MPIRRPSRRNPHTFLVHVFGRGLDGERYRAGPDGEIRPVREERPEGGRGRSRTVVGAGAVREMRPERDEIIVCTALDLKASGVQVWGVGAAGFNVSGVQTPYRVWIDSVFLRVGLGAAINRCRRRAWDQSSTAAARGSSTVGDPRRSSRARS